MGADDAVVVVVVVVADEKEHDEAGRANILRVVLRHALRLHSSGVDADGDEVEDDVVAVGVDAVRDTEAIARRQERAREAMAPVIPRMEEGTLCRAFS